MSELQGLSKIDEAIQWHEGMLLAPQHFQQWSLRQEQLLHYAMHIIAPFSWGVRLLKIDPILLLNGQFCILELEAIMPDGLVVTHSAEDEDFSLDLTAQLDHIKYQNMMVYLGIALHTTFLTNERYKSVEGGIVTDMNTGEAALNIPRLKPRIRLMIGEEPSSSKWTYFPLAQLKYKDEAVALTDFIPPTLQVTLRSALGNKVTHIITRAREKAAQLSERLNSPVPAVRTDKPLLFETQNILQGLVSLLPQLEAVLYTNTTHPYALYLSLCSLAGSIATCTSAKVPPVFAAYNHNDLQSTFTPVCHFIHDSLDNIHENYMVMSFHDQDQQFILKPESEWLERYFVIGARISPKSSQAELIKWIEGCMIGSESQIASMSQRRILGTRRFYIDKDEDLDLIAPRGVVLFRVDVNNEFIDPEQALHILSEQKSVHRPSEIMFFVKIVQKSVQE
ncbi:MAG: type VI secretion system baseplate subunit TssK [Thiotrichaceae bacterium]|nr:type VI secretion system baseplate subunit TssK [Thiotrichaceae bacterium]